MRSKPYTIGKKKLKHLTMTPEEFWEKYQIIENHLDANASFQDENGKGVMFETYGKELAFVRKQDNHNIFTYVDADEGTGIIEGYHLCNRIGYFIGKKKWAEKISIFVRISNDN